MPEKQQITATVEKVVEGRHGPYAVARASGVEGTITFSLEDSWKESDRPAKGVAVVLSDLRRKKAGWRAMSGRYLRPRDEKTTKGGR